MDFHEKIRVNESVWQRALQNFQAGRFDAAIADCEYLIHGAMVWPMAFPLLSSIYLHLGRIKLANYYAVAATRHLDGLNWDEILRISTSLIMVGENSLAHHVLNDIESRQFEPATAYFHLGRQYSTLEDIPRALTCFESAIAAGNQSADVYLMYGLNCAHAGKIDEARSAYEKAISRQPDLTHAHWAKAQLAKKVEALGHVEQMQSIFAGKQGNAINTAYVEHAFYKEFERAGKFDSAWASLGRAADARRILQPYDPVKEQKIFQSLASAFVADIAGGHQQEGPAPIFIVGMPRTGTTLLERILGNHSEIQPCGELQVMHHQMQWVLDIPVPMTLDESTVAALGHANFHELGQRYLQKTAWLSKGKKFFSDKHPMNFMFCGAILKALPDAKIIHMQRNPMDSCFSNYKELFAPGYYPYSYALSDCAAHYKNYWQLMRAWQTLWPGKILNVRYENLVTDPQGESRRIFDYLGLEHSDHLVDIQNNKTLTTTASSMQVRESIHSRNVAGWKTYADYLSGLRSDLEAEIIAYEQS